MLINPLKECKEQSNPLELAFFVVQFDFIAHSPLIVLDQQNHLAHARERTHASKEWKIQILNDGNEICRKNIN